MVAVERVGERLHPRRPAPDVIEAMIQRQAIQPGANRRVALVGADLPVRLQEDFLEQVLAIIRRARHPARQRVNPCSLPAVQDFERIDIAGPAAAGHVLVGRTHCQLFRRKGDNGALPRGSHVSRYDKTRGSGSDPGVLPVKRGVWLPWGPASPDCKNPPKRWTSRTILSPRPSVADPPPPDLNGVAAAAAFSDVRI